MVWNPMTLFTAPELNPISKKSLTINFNPYYEHGRVLLLSCFGFWVAFLSWYAWSPLLTPIKNDLHLSTKQVSNSNILALTATLLVRLVSGTLCDMFGPRWVFVGILLVGAIPTACAPAITSATGLILVRFFVGILGGAFVPCQVWTTAFYDKKVVGTANALTGGWGNSGGGITYFIMPAVYNALMKEQKLSSHDSWRRAFYVPFACIVFMALVIALFSPDTPVGPWSQRQIAVEQNLANEHAAGHSIVSSGLTGAKSHSHATHSEDIKEKSPSGSDIEAATTGEVIEVDAEYTHEVVQKPTFKETLKVAFSLQTITLCAEYFNTFGSELAINSILGAWYQHNFNMNITAAGRWAAMFGLLNIYGRPLGGFVSDIIYNYTGGSVWAKKAWMHFLGITMGIFCIIIGVLDSHDRSTMFGLIAGLAFFMDAGNGAVYSIVPHTHPYANGIVSGVVGASGNLGGIIGAVIFRYNVKNNVVQWGRAVWIIGIIAIAMNLAFIWVRPIPRGQIGGK